MTGDVALLVTLGALLALTVAALLAGGVGRMLVPVRALARAAAQLAVVALVLAAAFTDGRAAAAFVLVMLVAVAVTSGRRLGGGRRRVGAVLLASACGAVPVVGLLVGVGAFPRTPRYVIAFSGIVLGATMTVCTLAGRRLRDQVTDRWAEVEGYLALGASPRQAIAPFLPPVLWEALLPGVDQTRTTGLVTLPGSFVGALAGGASPGDAARFQLAVLAALLAAQTVSGVVLLRLLAPDVAVAPPPRR